MLSDAMTQADSLYILFYFCKVGIATGSLIRFSPMLGI